METPIVIVLAAGLLFFLLALYYMRRRFSIYFFTGTLIAVIAAGILHLQPAFIYGSTETASEETASSRDDEEAPPTKEEAEEEEEKEADAEESNAADSATTEEESTEEEPEEEPVEEDAPSDANTDAEDDGNELDEAQEENLDNPGATKADSYDEDAIYYENDFREHHKALMDDIDRVQSVLNTYDQNYEGESNQALYAELESLRNTADDYAYLPSAPDGYGAFDSKYYQATRLVYDGLGFIDYAIWDYEDYGTTDLLEEADDYMRQAYGTFQDADELNEGILEGVDESWKGIQYDYES